MRTSILIYFFLTISLVFVACGELSPEQEKLLTELKAEIQKTNKAVAEALQIPADLILKLNNKEITPNEFKLAMAESKNTIAEAQNNFSNALAKYDDVKASGITNAQIGYSVLGGTVGRTALHFLATWLTGLGGIWGTLGGLATGVLGGSKSHKIQVQKE